MYQNNKRRRNERPSAKKLRAQRMLTQSQYSRSNVNEMICPYCGKKLVKTDAEKINSPYKNNLFLACEDYPKCDTYCKYKIEKGKEILTSTPANASLRMLRKQAHFYIDQIVKNGISKEADLYNYFTSRHVIEQHASFHVGMHNEYTCMQVINDCIRLLHLNKERLSSFSLWNDQGKGVLTEENKEKAAELNHLYGKRLR